MGLYESLVRPALFRLDPETAHKLALRAAARGLVPAASRSSLPRTLFGVTFPNPIGLAAGFDKDGEALEHWHKLGFGFVEVGTVTRHPQEGNPKPRLFRLPAQRALINRMGFNNAGSEALARRLEGAHAHIPVGVNIGKSKVTPLEEADEDYAFSYRILAPLADYAVVNVSSPNTQGLRSLQDREPLRRILGRLREVAPERPLFLKVSPDLGQDQFDEVLAVCEECRLTGLVATNTTVARPGVQPDEDQEGGLSGQPLGPLADQALSHLRRNGDPSLVLIGSGGVMEPSDARRKFELGADLIQVYTGFVYGGPGFVPSLVEGLPLQSLSRQRS